MITEVRVLIFLPYIGFKSLTLFPTPTIGSTPCAHPEVVRDLRLRVGAQHNATMAEWLGARLQI